MTNKYNDIIDLPHPTSARHPRMRILDRAAQFSPFSALVGYEDAIEESGRLTQDIWESDNDEKEALDRKLRYLRDHPNTKITLTYFIPDKRKAGGAYLHTEAVAMRVDSHKQCLITEDLMIPMKHIRELQIADVDL